MESLWRTQKNFFLTIFSFLLLREVEMENLSTIPFLPRRIAFLLFDRWTSSHTDGKRSFINATSPHTTYQLFLLYRPVILHLIRCSLCIVIRRIESFRSWTKSNTGDRWRFAHSHRFVVDFRLGDVLCRGIFSFEKTSTTGSSFAIGHRLQQCCVHGRWMSKRREGQSDLIH